MTSKLTQTIGFIGAGNMARAILHRILKNGVIEPEQAIVSDSCVEKGNAATLYINGRVAKSNAELAEIADVVIFAIKPDEVSRVCEEIRPHIRAGQLFVLISARTSTKDLEEGLGGNAHVVCVKPNMPVQAKFSTADVTAGNHSTPEDMDLAHQIFDFVGKIDKLDETIGFIGAGMMARSILRGMQTAGLVESEQTIVSDVSVEQGEAVNLLTGAQIAKSNTDLVDTADVVVFAVKPYQVSKVCEEIRSHIRPGQLFISICAGISTKFIEERLGGNVSVIRVMPNTPALIGCGAAAIASGSHTRPGDMDLVSRVFNSVGISVCLNEDQLDLVTGLTGSGPAYVFRFTEALIDAAVELGMPKDAALTLVLQMVYGAARMASESTNSLAGLRQWVTTKGGTTEAGLKVLEEGEFGALIRDCVEAAKNRSAELSKG